MIVFGIGLPRCGGQTLQQCLIHLLHGKVWHSPGNNFEKCVASKPVGMVEVFAPVDYLMDRFPSAKFIYNTRSERRWMASCRKVYEKSQTNNWNHPLWKYPFEQFQAYREEYECRRYQTENSGFPLLVWDIEEHPDWGPLCSFLGIPVPPTPFPNVDNHGRETVDLTGNDDWLFPSPW